VGSRALATARASSPGFSIGGYGRSSAAPAAVACPLGAASGCAPGAAAARAAGPEAPRARAAGPDVASTYMATAPAWTSSAGGSSSMEGRSPAWGRERAGDLHGEAAGAGVLAQEGASVFSRLRVYGVDETTESRIDESIHC